MFEEREMLAEIRIRQTVEIANNLFQSHARSNEAICRSDGFRSVCFFNNAWFINMRR